MKTIILGIFLSFVITSIIPNIKAQLGDRKTISLNQEWLTSVNDTSIDYHNGFESQNYPLNNWESVNIPHNWDKYEGYRRMIHGNRHGYAWYRKEFKIKETEPGKKYFLFFEGVGSYATVWLNGEKVGYHAGGRTTFTLDISNVIKTDNNPNILAIRADHPANIRDLPWVCGGCSSEWGFSEGSQPFGIFRPVSLVVTNDIRVEPFGIHIWNDNYISEEKATLNINTEVKNYSSEQKEITILHKLIDKDGKIKLVASQKATLASLETDIISIKNKEVVNPHLWSTSDPYLYTLVTEVYDKEVVIDQTSTKYGIRWISWPQSRNDGDNRFYLNGKPVFINGTAEYEHMIGKSHAFTSTQVEARVMQMKSAGFNSFRDAHQPHNLRYQENWDSLGILFWTQMAAHIWFDNESFKTNFKQLLRDWVKERRNCPSVILYGLENESTLPTWFAEECTQIIREMDPTSPSQRLVTTCNGGTGTDWNVIQNWSGTYAGDLYEYDKDISREILNGEYGAWRSIDLHSEGPFKKNGIYSEDRMCQLMETKVRLAEQAKDSCCGQYQWIFNSHDNPGRTQNGEGIRELDRIGPVNYKGLITPWGEPLDVYYMYRSNYISSETEPMVYIASHTWPNRWVYPGVKDSITVYSNCDEVELFNDIKAFSFGKKQRGKIGTHFQWDNVNVQYNTLYAIGYKNGLPVTSDVIVLQNLPNSPGFERLLDINDHMTAPKPGYHYLYRYNCGGAEYIDEFDNVWHADQKQEKENTFGSHSWTDNFEGMPDFLASQRRTFDPIVNSPDWKLFQTFRYGRNQLSFNFPVPDGEYNVELFFIEPWYGTNGSMNCKNWRVFDVAINNQIAIDDMDIWKEAGHDKVFKKTFKVKIEGGSINIDFPEVKSGQAVISAIAIASKKRKIKQADAPEPLIQNLTAFNKKEKWEAKKWLDIGDHPFTENEATLLNLPSIHYGSEWIQLPHRSSGIENIASFTAGKEVDVFIALQDKKMNIPVWLNDYVKLQDKSTTTENGGTSYSIFAKRFKTGDLVILGENITAPYMVVVNPVTSLGQASDQRPTNRRWVKDAKQIGTGLKQGHFKTRDYLEYTRNIGDTIEWDFKVGLGDTYSIQIKYLNNEEENIPMHLKIIDMYGVIVKEENIEFTPRANSWRVYKTTTGTSINAGTYRLQLSTVGKSGLGVYAVDVQ